MAKGEKERKEKKAGNDLSKPDPETLHKTDPQESMEGPVSSLMQDIKENTEKNDNESKDEAGERSDRNK